MMDAKHEVLGEIRNSVSIFKEVNSNQYRIRCPICGDSQKNLESAHCYIKCSYDQNEPLLFHCFLCNSSGIVNKSFLDKLGIKSKHVDKLSYNRRNVFSKANNKDINIDVGNPKNSPQTKYIDDRLGPGFTLDDYDKFRIVWNMDNIFQYITSTRIKNSIPNNINSISFLSDDKSSLLTRSFTDENGRWSKLKIIPIDNGPSFYTIKTVIDLFTKEDIIVNIAEGIFDVLSIYKNFTDDYANSVFIAVLGSDYISGLNYMINKGFVGSNIIIKVYIDSNINEREIKKSLKPFKWLFKQIIVLRNIKNKDVGVKIEDIKLSNNPI